MIDLAICGMGRWGQRLVESVQFVSKDVRFTHGVSRQPERVADAAARLGLTVVSSIDDVLRNPAIAGVVLATPHSQHSHEILAVAAAGKHVFVEKPLTLTAESAERAVAAVAAAGRVLGVGFNRRFAPSYLDLAARIRTGEIGDILHIDAHHSGPGGHALKPGSWRADRIESPAGGMTARGIHTLDLMIALAGPVANVFCRSDRRTIAADIDDTTSASLRFAGGATGNLTTIFATAELWRVQVFGSKGWLEMSGDATVVARDNAGITRKVALANLDKERAALEAFARAVRGEAPFPVAGRDAVNGIAVMQAMVVSAADARPVDISQR